MHLNECLIGNNKEHAPLPPWDICSILETQLVQAAICERVGRRAKQELTDICSLNFSLLGTMGLRVLLQLLLMQATTPQKNWKRTSQIKIDTVLKE